MIAQDRLDTVLEAQRNAREASERSAMEAELLSEDEPEEQAYEPPPELPHYGSARMPEAQTFELSLPRQELATSKSALYIAEKILAKSIEMGQTLIVEKMDDKLEAPVFAYDGGRFRPLHAGWLFDQVATYDGAISVTQKTGAAQRTKEAKAAGRKGQPVIDEEKWHANLTNINSVQGLLRRLIVRGYDVPVGESPLRHNAPMATVFRNGTICWDNETGAMRFEKHSPAHRATWRFEYDYEPGLVPELFLRTFSHVFKNCSDDERSKRIGVLRAMAGIAFLGCYEKVKRSLWLMGSGNDGKGVYTDLIQKLMPEHCSSGVTPSLLDDKFNGPLILSKLSASRVNFGHEVKKIPSPENIKSCLVCEPREGRNLGQEHKTFRSTALFINDSNYPMPKTVVDSAWERRWVVVLFENPIPANYTKLDREIVNKLAILNGREFVCWAIDGALEVLANEGSFDLPECHSRAMRAWKIASQGAEGGDGSGVSPSVQEFLEYLSPKADAARTDPRAKLPKLTDLYGRKVGMEYLPACCYLDWFHSLSGRQYRDQVPRAQFSREISSCKGVVIEVSHGQKVVRFTKAFQCDKPAPLAPQAPRRPCSALDTSKPCDPRDSLTKRIAPVMTATQEFEKSSAKPWAAKGNVVSINRKDPYSDMFDNESDSSADEPKVSYVKNDAGDWVEA